ncbi:hypothetical protein BS78_06G054700 [Paspalum vaginatum]|nr:hypothetical protein BS78_06G054700 [Paspalum vaginatum]
MNWKRALLTDSGGFQMLTRNLMFRTYLGLCKEDWIQFRDICMRGWVERNLHGALLDCLKINHDMLCAFKCSRKLVGWLLLYTGSFLTWVMRNLKDSTKIINVDKPS